MPVFDEFERTDWSEARYGENDFNFLNRTPMPYWSQVRQLVNDWYSHLPKDAQSDIRGRLRKGGENFRNAFWEMYIHESLLRAGYEVDLHPEIPGTSKRVDFLARSKEGEFYVEATSIGESQDQIAQQNLKNRFYDAIQGVRSPNFLLRVQVEKTGKSSPSSRVLRKALEPWLAQHDPDQFEQDQMANWHDTPREVWEFEGWRVIFKIFPKSPEYRGDPGTHSIGILNDEPTASAIDDARPLKNALTAKGSRYGNLDKPYIIAVLSTGLFFDNEDAKDALYGTYRIRVNFNDDNAPTGDPFRTSDGYWHGPHGWIHKHVSAVLIGQNIWPWTVAKLEPVLWEHPDPDRPISSSLPWRRKIVKDDEIMQIPAKVKPSERFGIPAEWPVGGRFQKSAQRPT
jgi:hypothetical protein